MSKYYVVIDYRTKKGRPASCSIYIEAHDHGSAIDAGIERVRKYKSFLKLDGGSAQALPGISSR